MLIVIKAAWRNLWRNKRRTLFLVSAITIGLLGVIFFQSFMNGYKASMRDNAVATLTGHAKITAPGYQDNPVPSINFPRDEDRLLSLRRNPVVRGAASRVVGMVMASNAERSDRVTLVGVEPSFEKDVSIIPEAIVEGRWLKKTDVRKLVVGGAFCRRFKTKLGRRVVLMAYDTVGEISSQSFRIVGVFKSPTDSFDRSTVYATLSETQKFFALQDRVTEVVLWGDSAENAEALTELAENLWKGAGVQIKSWRELLPLMVQMFKLWDSVMGVFYLIYFIAMAFGIANTFLMVVHERTREFGVILALGVSRGMVMLMMIFESAFLAAFASLIGVGVGVASSAYFFKAGIDLSFAAEGMEFFGAASVIHPYLTPADVLKSFAATIFTAMIVSLYPAWKAGRVQPAEAIRME